MARKEFLGGVSATTLDGDMTSVATTFSVTSGGGSTFPTGSSYPFVVVVGRGTAAEEKILCTSRSGDTFTVTSRGYDGTSAVAHTGNPAVEHCVDALTLSEASELYNLPTTQGDTVYATGSAAWARLAKGTAYQAYVMNSGATAPSWAASLQSLMTAQGDIVYASSANTPARLAKGTAGQSLMMNTGATAPEWVGAIGCRATRTTAQTIATGTWTEVSFDAEAFDSSAIHDTGSNPSRFTVPTGRGGMWLVGATIPWSTSASGERGLRVAVNGSAVDVLDNRPGSGSIVVVGSGSMLLNLSAADYVTFEVEQDTGGNLDIASGAGRLPSGWAYYVGP